MADANAKMIPIAMADAIPKAIPTTTPRTMPTTMTMTRTKMTMIPMMIRTTKARVTTTIMITKPTITASGCEPKNWNTQPEGRKEDHCAGRYDIKPREETHRVCSNLRSPFSEVRSALSPASAFYRQAVGPIHCLL